MKAMIYKHENGSEDCDFFDVNTIDDLLNVLDEHGYPPMQINIEDDEYCVPRMRIEIFDTEKPVATNPIVIDPKKMHKGTAFIDGSLGEPLAVCRSDDGTIRIYRVEE